MQGMQRAGIIQPFRSHIAQRPVRRRHEIGGLALQGAADFIQHGGADTIGAALIFCTCWKVTLIASASAS